MSGWIQDLRYGLRTLATRPTVSAVTVLSLALGIGANVAIFSVFNAVFLRPLPYPEPERLVMVGLDFERAAVGTPDRRARGGNDDCVFHDVLPGIGVSAAWL